MSQSSENVGMVVLGTVRNGVVVVEGDANLPEGAVVTITYGDSPSKKASAGHHRIEVPLVRTGQPATVQLTGERIAEILDQEDGAP
jgi:hypothetical protein